MTPQKVPVHQTHLLKNLATQQSGPGFLKKPIQNVGLAEHLRAIKNPETVSVVSSMRSLVRSIKTRSLRNEPLIGDGLVNVSIN